MTALTPISMSSAGVSAPTLINVPVMTNGASPSYQLGLICTVPNGTTLTYSVQVTADQSPSSTGNWNNSSVVSVTTSTNGLINYPVTGVRVNVATLSAGTLNVGIALWP